MVPTLQIQNRIPSEKPNLKYVQNTNIHFQVLANADQVEEARNDAMKLDNTVHELNNTVQDELHYLNNTVQDGLHDLNNTVQEELHDLNIAVQDGLQDLDISYHELDNTVHELNNTVKSAEIDIINITG